MSAATVQETGTVFDHLLALLQSAASYNHDDVVPPAAILWTDEKREWERLVPRLRMVLPHFLVFGPHDLANRTGAAIWLRCVLAGKVSPPGYAGGSPVAVPIIYLPGVNRAVFRHPEDCPNDLKPVFELQFRGVIWSQANGKDWTVTSFLQTNHGGLQLKVARDNATAASIRRALEKLVDVPLAELRSRSAAGELNSTWFDSLVSDDLVDDLLSWLSDPKGTKARWEANRWETLCSRCQADYGFDPARDGELAGAERLGLQDKNVWKTAWKRFAAAPVRYPGLVELLRRARPQTKTASLFESPHVESWPQDNEAEETALRQALLAAATEPVAEARLALLELEAKHKHRRDWVWTRINQAPLAQAIQHLAVMAEVTQASLAGATVADMVNVYTETGWQADAAVLDGLASVSHPQDREAVCAAVAHVYAPWLRDAAELFQQRAKEGPLPGRELPRLAAVPVGTCVLFADGLRYDVSRKLRAALEAKVGPVQAHHHFVALPPVTPTAKPAVSPVAGKIKGTTAGEEFRPCLALDDKELTTDRFRKLLEDENFQFLGVDETGDPTGWAWTEFGELDKAGHVEGSKLAYRIAGLVTSLVYRIEALLAAGWQEVRVDRVAKVPGGDPLGPVCGGQARSDCRAELLLLVLGGGRANRLSARDRLLHCRQGIQPRRAELAGVPGAAALHPSWCSPRGLCENRQCKMVAAAVPDHGRQQL